MPLSDPMDMPDSPVSPAMHMAIAWHEGFTALMEAGFTREEAFKLTSAQWKVYWESAYDDMITTKHKHRED